MDKLHFINTEYFWGLLFLLIPIVVHLFNFRKAKTIFFTRVDLLKEIKTKKRNFSTLKKRLILFTRLSAILFLVLAASSPYLSEVDLNNKSNKATFIYLDNSFSMQAKLGDVSLMELSKNSIKNIYNDFSSTSQVYLLTNKGFSKINSKNELNLELSKVYFGYESFSSIKVKSRVSNLAEREMISDFNTIVFSDFNEGIVEEDSLFAGVNITKKRFYTDEFPNISVDSLWLERINISESKFTVAYKLSNYGDEEIEFSESFTFDEKIQQSLTRKIKPNSYTVISIQLSLPNSKKANGQVSIKDRSIWYDNDLFFSVDFNEKSKALFVGDKSNKRLTSILNDDFIQLENTSYSGFKTIELDEFDFLIYTLRNNYSVEEIELLKEYLDKGKELLLIPSSPLTLKEFNSYLKELEIGSVYKFNSNEVAVTDISYQNQFFDDIFNSKVENFEYPILTNSFFVNIPKSENLLKLENGNPFLLKSKNTYLFTSSIFNTERPFVENDLALPILYKMASSSSRRSLFENIGENSEVKISAVENVSIDLEGERLKLNKLDLNNFEFPEISKSGNYNLYSSKKFVKSVSYNYKRNESILRGNNETESTPINRYEELKNQSNVIYLWKWCITFTLAFLIIEMLLISFLKEKSIKISE